MSDQTLDINNGVVWQRRIGRHGVFDVAVNGESVRVKELVAALRSREGHAYQNGWSIWLLPDGSPARRRRTDE